MNLGRRQFFLAALLVALLLRPFASFASDSSAPRAYTRIANPDTNTVQLQIALRKFTAPGNGPVIWLAAVMHIGEPEYYHALQKFLDRQTVVLYEGINARAHKRHFHDSPAEPPEEPIHPPPSGGTNDEYSMQSSLARSLGLVFQLEAIDYDRTNFLNSDLSITQIQDVMAEGHIPVPEGQGGDSNVAFNVLLQVMDGSSFLGSMVKAGLQFLGQSPQLQAMIKLCLIEGVGRLKGDLANMQGLPPDWSQLIKVLIEARNKNLVDDLGEEIKKIPATGSIAVFYGAGHMDDMEQRITSQLHYRPEGDVWLPAFSVDLRKSGISPFEAEWMGELIKGQMEQVQNLQTATNSNK